MNRPTRAIGAARPDRQRAVKAASGEVAGRTDATPVSTARARHDAGRERGRRR